MLETRGAARSLDPPPIALTVVVPTLDRGPSLLPTVRALLDAPQPDLAVLIIDQSADDSAHAALVPLLACDHRLRYLRSAALGVSHSRNLGLSLAEGAVVVFVDDDCLLASGWLEVLHEEFRDPLVSAVCGRILPAGPSDGGPPLAVRTAAQRQVFRGARTPPWHVGSGGCLAVRRNIMLALGGFDPLLGPGAPLHSGEDSDLLHRLLSAGHTVVYAPRLLAYHMQWKDRQAQRRAEQGYARGAGAQFAKDVRCGDLLALYLLATWIWQLGARRVGAGLLKWHSAEVMRIGFYHLVLPAYGVLESLRYPIDRAPSVPCGRRSRRRRKGGARRMGALTRAGSVPALVPRLRARLAGPDSSAEDRPWSVPVLLYHRVVPTPPARDPYGICTSAALFARQLHWLRWRGYRPLTLDAIEQAFALPDADARALLRRGVVITFDDGYADTGTVAWPLLQRYGFSASVFVVTDAVGGVNAFDAADAMPARMLTAAEIRELQQAGWLIGSHSCGHPASLTDLDDAELRRELVDSRVRLESITQRPVRYFAYPHSQLDGRVAAAVERAGYTLACAGRGTRTARFALSRIEPPRLPAAALEGYLAYRSAKRTLRRLATRVTVRD